MGLNFRKKEGLVKRCLAPAVFAAAGFLGCGGGGGETTPVNEAPVAVNDVAGAIESNPVTIDVLLNDSDLEDGIPLLESVTQPVNGTTSIVSDQIVYTRTNSNFYGIDTFSYRIIDLDGATDIGNVRVWINKDNSKLEYLVITKDFRGDPARSNLKPYAQTLADWKKEKGVGGVLVRTVEEIEIDDGYNSSDTPNNIRDFIIDQNPKFVCLFGDSIDSDSGDLLPHRGVSCTNSVYEGLSLDREDDLACDWFFANDDNWDFDGDGFYGERGLTQDDPGLSFEFKRYVGRLPVETITEASNVVTKTINYEKCNIQTDYITKGGNNFLSCAELLSLDTDVGGNYIDDSADAEDWIFTGSGIDFSGFGIKKLYENYTIYPGAEEETRLSVLAALNQGWGFAKIYGHGNPPQVFVNLSLEDIIDSNDVENLSNVNRPFMAYLLGCENGHYRDKNSLAKKIINGPNGAFFVISADGIGIYTPGTGGGGASWENDLAFYQKLLDPNRTDYRAGKIVADFKTKFVNDFPSTMYNNKNFRWVGLSTNAFVDPETDIKTDHLGNISATPTQMSDYLEVIVKDDIADDLPNAKVCVSQGINAYTTFTDSKGKAVFNVTGSVDKIVTTMHNYKPNIWTP